MADADGSTQSTATAAPAQAAPASATTAPVRQLAPTPVTSVAAGSGPPVASSAAAPSTTPVAAPAAGAPSPRTAATAAPGTLGERGAGSGASSGSGPGSGLQPPLVNVKAEAGAGAGVTHAASAAGTRTPPALRSPRTGDPTTASAFSPNAAAARAVAAAARANRARQQQEAAADAAGATSTPPPAKADTSQSAESGARAATPAPEAAMRSASARSGAGRGVRKPTWGVAPPPQRPLPPPAPAFHTACPFTMRPVCRCTFFGQVYHSTVDMAAWQRRAGVLASLLERAQEGEKITERLRRKYAGQTVSEADLVGDTALELERVDCVRQRRWLTGEPAPDPVEEALGEPATGQLRFVPADLYNYRQFARQFYTRRPPLAQEVAKAKTVVGRAKKVEKAVVEKAKAKAQKQATRRAKKKRAAAPNARPTVLKRVRTSASITWGVPEPPYE